MMMMIKVTNECNSTFGAVVDTGYIADNADCIFEPFCVWPEWNWDWQKVIIYIQNVKECMWDV